VEGVRPEHRLGELSDRVLIALLALSISALAIVGTETRALADGYTSYGHTGVSTGPGSVGVSANSSVTGAGSSGEGSSPIQCTYAQVAPADAGVLGIGGPMPGDWVIETCTGPGYVNPMKAVWVPAVLMTNLGQQQSDPSSLAHQAASQLQLPAAIVGMSPAASSLTVNVPTWLWVDRSAWQGMSATASAGPVSATAAATPSEVVWDMGDGEQITCTGPGAQWTPSAQADDPSGCSYTYSRSSTSQPHGTYTITTTVYWHVVWTSQGAPGGGDLGLISGPSTRTTVRVQEVHAVNRGPSS
jgi:hypothetical protein